MRSAEEGVRQGEPCSVGGSLESSTSPCVSAVDVNGTGLPSDTEMLPKLAPMYREETHSWGTLMGPCQRVLR